MVDINKKEKTLSQETQPIQPGVSETIPDSTETVTQESPIQDIVRPEVATETPEAVIEQAQEQISGAQEVPTKAKPAPISAIMKDKELMQDLKDVMNLEKPKQVKSGSEPPNCPAEPRRRRGQLIHRTIAIQVQPGIEPCYD